MTAITGLVIWGSRSGAPATPPVKAQNAAVSGSTRGDHRWRQFTHETDNLAANDVRTIRVDHQHAALWFGGDVGLSYFDGAWQQTSLTDVAGSPAVATKEAAAEGDFHPQPGAVTAIVRNGETGHLWAATSEGWILRLAGRSEQGNPLAWEFVMALRSSIYALDAVAGELWLGTEDGLYRFDGVEPTLVDALGRRPVYSLLVHQRTVWAGTADGLWRHRAGDWLQLGAGESSLATGVLDLMYMPDGTLVAGTAVGLAWQDYPGARWDGYSVYDELGDPAPVQALAVDTYGWVWAGTDGAGAFALRLDRDESVNYGYTGDPDLPTRFVRDIAVDVDGSIWLATPVGVLRYQGAMWQNDVQGAPDDLRNHINCLLVARDGSLWIGTAGGGVRRKDPATGKETLWSAADGAASSAYALVQDATGAIWIGGETGVRRYVDGAWTAPSLNDELPSPVVTSLLADGQWLWIGTATGLSRAHLATGEVAHVSATDDRSVEALAKDNLGRLWVGTRGSGVWLHQRNGEWRVFVHEEDVPGSLSGNSISSHGLAADSNVEGGMWAVVFGEELAHWNGERWEQEEDIRLNPSNLIWTAYTDPGDGSLWMGSESGVTRYDGISTGTLNQADGLQSANVYTIVRAPDGSYWFGGRTGLSHFRPDQTPPWVRIDNVAGPVNMEGGGAATLHVGDELLVNFSAGDLQTNRNRLEVLARVVGPDVSGTWRPLSGDVWAQRFAEPGDYQIELRARDLSFNYSPVTRFALHVALPPEKVTLPVLGPVELRIFRTLALFGSMAVAGALYMILVVVNNRRRSLGALARAYNPYISGEPVRRQDMFFARRDLLQRIIDTLHSNSIMIYGERRIGKTSLLYQLVTHLREVDDPDYWFVPVYIDLEGTPQELFFYLLIEEITAAIELLEDADVAIVPYLTDLRYLTHRDRPYTDRDFNRDLNRVTEVLEVYGEGRDPGKQLRLILLLDEMDVMSKYDRIVQQQLRRIFMREFAATLGAVVAGIQISKEWDRVESPWFNLFNEIALIPFSREEAIELLIEPVRDIYQYEPAALEFIIEHAEGRPFKLQQYGLEAVSHMLANGRRRILLVDAEVAHRRILAAEREQSEGMGVLARLRRAAGFGGSDAGSEKRAPDDDEYGDEYGPETDLAVVLDADRGDYNDNVAEGQDNFSEGVRD